MPTSMQDSMPTSGQDRVTNGSRHHWLSSWQDSMAAGLQHLLHDRC
eukprot:CAMPEP_0181180724 /NCGR_PEP_ID=MMETSP1096-20121128/6953_1 /TAXON_ID=156174 ORGANISM="Chrysochromulina ericina, Strain CCMP281" /NCGR_SAMPLE_ID=MMETSP1096 /ASSEMBLY_ACC=CAM_ASM_000453 /LENGTH=45 /DNA_ID= /DNA_START= /DNA_END= /DNA_ORIENTATION=